MERAWWRLRDKAASLKQKINSHKRLMIDRRKKERLDSILSYMKCWHISEPKFFLFMPDGKPFAGTAVERECLPGQIQSYFGYKDDDEINITICVDIVPHPYPHGFEVTTAKTIPFVRGMEIRLSDNTIVVDVSGNIFKSSWEVRRNNERNT